MTLLIISFVAFGIVMLVMAIGVIFQGKCLRGSCGGEAILGPDGELLNCDTCPARKEREEELHQQEQATRP